METYAYLIGFLVLMISGFSGVVFWIIKGVRKDVEEALKNATPDEQAEIRKKVVKAVFPPRFPRG